MYILHITATHMNKMGGVPIVLNNLIKEQNKIQGFRSRLLSLKAPTDEWRNPFFDYLDNKSFDEYLSKDKPDIVIFHSFFLIDYLKCYKTVLSHGIKYMIEPHGSFVKAGYQKSKIKKIIANNTIFRGFIKKSYGYVFLSNEERGASIYQTDNDVIIPNGVVERNVSYKPHTDVKFYYIGRFDIHEKGLDYLFEALNVLEKQRETIHIELIGGGSDLDVKQINQLISKFQYVKVTNVGPLYGVEKEKYIDNCDIMILPSLHEGFPMTVLEALQSGKPCMVSKGTNVLNMITENEIGWEIPNTPEMFAQLLLSLSKSYNAIAAYYHNRCIEYIKTNFLWCHIAKKSYIELYKVFTI